MQAGYLNQSDFGNPIWRGLALWGNDTWRQFQSWLTRLSADETSYAVLRCAGYSPALYDYVYLSPQRLCICCRRASPGRLYAVAFPNTAGKPLPWSPLRAQVPCHAAIEHSTGGLEHA